MALELNLLNYPRVQTATIVSLGMQITFEVRIVKIRLRNTFDRFREIYSCCEVVILDS